MPIYTYVCESCSARYEKLMPSFSAGNNVEDLQCPSCGDTGKSKRVWHTVGMPIFKGTGFYKTDYASEKPKESSPSSSGGSAPAPPSGG